MRPTMWGTQAEIDKLFEELPAFGDFGKASDSGIYIGKDVKSYVKQLDMNFSDGTHGGSAFIITGVENIIPQVKSLVRDMIVTIIVS